MNAHQKSIVKQWKDKAKSDLSESQEHLNDCLDTIDFLVINNDFTFSLAKLSDLEKVTDSECGFIGHSAEYLSSSKLHLVDISFRLRHKKDEKVDYIKLDTNDVLAVIRGEKKLINPLTGEFISNFTEEAYMFISQSSLLREFHEMDYTEEEAMWQ